MKKKIIIILFILIVVVITLTSLYKERNPKIYTSYDNSINEYGKHISNEEYIYKEDLLTLGYNLNEIDIINNKVNITDVKDYLLNKKYNDLTKFISSPKFNIKNIERYQNYKNKTHLNIDEVVINVEIGLDNEFYTNMNKTDTTLNYNMIVNKYNYLEKDYVPELVEVEKDYGKGKAEKEAYNYFKKMVDEAKKDNIILKSVSFYRSYDTQKSLYNTYSKRDGQKKADEYSARAGHSEHQTGLAVDINTSSSKDKFENTKEYTWLINNSYKYGFILRYPKNKTNITGYKYEPWHFRYIGIESATKIYQEQITFEEYYYKYII